VKNSRFATSSGRFSDAEAFYFMVTSLSALSACLRKVGVVIFIATMVNVAILVASVTDIIYAGKSEAASSFGRAVFLIINFIVFTLLMLSLGFFDISRKKGDVFFQDVSNAFQDLESMHAPDDNRLPLTTLVRARIELRRFSLVADPPLVRGRLGLLIYALANIVVILESAALARF